MSPREERREEWGGRTWPELVAFLTTVLRWELSCLVALADAAVGAETYQVERIAYLERCSRAAS